MLEFFFKSSPRMLCKTGCVLALIGCLAGCGPSEKSESTPPVTSAQPEATAPAPPVAPVSQATKDTYQFYCTQCHGLKAKGDGINAKFLTVPPRDHTKAEYMETRSDEQLFTAIQQGGLSVGRAPCMPAWGHTLSDETIHSLVRYIRELCHCEAL